MGPQEDVNGIRFKMMKNTRPNSKKSTNKAKLFWGVRALIPRCSSGRFMSLSPAPDEPIEKSGVPVFACPGSQKFPQSDNLRPWSFLRTISATQPERRKMIRTCNRNVLAREKLRNSRNREKTELPTLPGKSKNWGWHPEEWVSWLASDPKSALERFKADFPGTRGDTPSVWFVRRLTESVDESSHAQDFVAEELAWRRTASVPSTNLFHSPEPRFVRREEAFGVDLALVNVSGKTIAQFRELGRETTNYLSPVSHSPDAFDDFVVQCLKLSFRKHALDLPTWLSPTVVIALSLLYSEFLDYDPHHLDYPLRWIPKAEPSDFPSQVYFEANAPQLSEVVSSLWLRVVREYSIAVFDGACAGSDKPLYHAFFPNLSRIRHGCRANVALTVRKNVLTLVSLRAIEPDEELIWSPWQLATLGVRRSCLPNVFSCAPPVRDFVVDPFETNSPMNHSDEFPSDARVCDSCRMCFPMDEVKRWMRKKFVCSSHDALKLASFVCKTRQVGPPDSLFDSACDLVVKACQRGRLSSGKRSHQSHLQLAFGPEPDDGGKYLDEDLESVYLWERDVVAFLWLDFGDLLIRKLGMRPNADCEVHRNCLREIADLLIQSVAERRPLLPIESDLSLRLFLGLISTACCLDEKLPPTGLFHPEVAHELHAFVIAWEHAVISVAVNLQEVELLHSRKKNLLTDDSLLLSLMIPPLCLATVPILRNACALVMQQFRREVFPPIAFKNLAEMLVQPKMSDKHLLGLEKLDAALCSPSTYFSFDAQTLPRSSSFQLALMYWHEFDRRDSGEFDDRQDFRDAMTGLTFPLNRILHMIAFSSSPLSKFNYRLDDE
jgi:hypothetical protein